MIEEPGGLGRRPAPDPRDDQYPLRPRTIPVLPKVRHWRMFHSPLDQGHEGSCVGHAWKHFLMASPVCVNGPKEAPLAVDIYKEAQKIDEWPGEAYEGTSVRAGAKILVAKGLVSEYRWATDIDTLATYLLTTGTVVMGTNWYEGMDAPDEGGFVRVTGRTRGGHAWLVLGYNRVRGVYRCVNSWGKSWGQAGRFWIAGEDLDRLLSEGGEACSATEV
jgi:hypothetical protein